MGLSMNVSRTISANVICEGCGVIQVNHKGECVSHDCDNGNHAVGMENQEIKTSILMLV